jgi:hypothetical protein
MKKLQRKSRLSQDVSAEEVSRISAEIRLAWTREQSQCVQGIFQRIAGLNNKELVEYSNLVDGLISQYIYACQLPGNMVSVLDNSIIQDFKHRKNANQRRREVRAEAFIAFCRFVEHWGSRSSSLALPAVAIYEHCGRKPCSSTHELERVLQELVSLLFETNLPIHMLGYRSPAHLVNVLNDIHDDAETLRELAKSIHSKNWKMDLKTDFGIKIPMAVAERNFPSGVQTKYFNPSVVKRTFSARIEELIIRQSKHNPAAMPISSGSVAKTLSKLNGIEKDILQGKIKGLGDLELLQYCSMGAQFHVQADHVFIGHTFDADLAKLLREFSGFVVSEGPIELGTPEAAKKATDSLMRGLFGNPFKEHDARMASVIPKARSFHCALLDACAMVEARR